MAQAGYGSVAPQQVVMSAAACLEQHSSVEIKEKVNYVEAITAALGMELEMANKYKVFASGGEQELFYAVEQTEFCTRQLKNCCPDCAPWHLHVLYTEGGGNQVAYELNRDCTCTCCCFNRPVVEIKDATGAKVGSIRDPFACCDLTFTLRDSADAEVLKAKGGCCQWGLCCPLPCGPCSRVEFDIVDASSGDSVGSVRKQVPSCLKWLIADNVDNYKVDFGGVKNSQWKMMLIALGIFMDYRYFNENSNNEAGGIVGAG